MPTRRKKTSTKTIKPPQQQTTHQSLERIYYAFPIDQKEYNFFMKKNIEKNRILQILEIIANTDRPTKPEGWVFVISDQNPRHTDELIFMICIISPKYDTFDTFIIDGKSASFNTLQQHLSKFKLEASIAIQEMKKYNIRDTLNLLIKRHYVRDELIRIKITQNSTTQSYFLVPIGSKDYKGIVEASREDDDDYILDLLTTIMSDDEDINSNSNSNYRIFVIYERHMQKPNELVFFVYLITPSTKKNGPISFVIERSTGSIDNFLKNLVKYNISKEKADNFINTYKLQYPIKNLRNEFFNIETKPLQLNWQEIYREDITKYVNDLNKQLTKQHKENPELKHIIDQKRQQLKRKFILDPTLSLEKGVVSRKNKPIIEQLRKKHLQQLFQKYGNDQSHISQKLHPYYHQKIHEKRIMPYLKRIQSGHQTLHDVIDDIVGVQLGLNDVIHYTPVKEPIILPSGYLIDKSTLQEHKRNLQQINKKRSQQGRRTLPLTDPGSNMNIQGVVFQQNSTIADIARKIDQQINQIMKQKQQDKNIKDKLVKLIQLRNKYQPLIKKQKQQKIRQINQIIKTKNKT